MNTRVRPVTLAASLLAIAFGSGFSGVACAGPITKIASLSTDYLTGAVEITWESSLTGGCTTSTVAVTNPGAANNSALTAVLLTAFSMDLSVEVTFGGGCGSLSSNWIQTVRAIK